MPTSRPLAFLPHLGPFVTLVTAGGQIWWTSDADLETLTTFSSTAPTQFILKFKNPLFNDVLLVTPLARSQGAYTHTAIITGTNGDRLSVDVYKESSGRLSLANAGLSITRFTPGRNLTAAKDRAVPVKRLKS